MTDTYIPPLPGEDEILAAALDVVETARGGRSFPPIRSQEWLDLPHDDKVAALLPLACAWLIEDPRQAVLQEMKRASLAVHGGLPRGMWAQIAARPTRADVERQRRVSA